MINHHYPTNHLWSIHVPVTTKQIEYLEDYPQDLKKTPNWSG